MSGYYYKPRRPHTRSVGAPLLVAAGLIGLPMAFALYQAWSEADDEEDAAATPAVDSTVSYPMNHFVPGAGYYHTPYRAWFPIPFNYYDATRGWYRGGRWRATATPDDGERREEGNLAGFSHGTGWTWPSASRPRPEAVGHANAGAATHSGGSGHIMRGGFGFSAHPSIS